MSPTTPRSIDEYIAGFLPDMRESLEQIRATIQAAAPEAQEAIKYGMPTFTLDGNLVYFAAYKYHIDFYATPNGSTAFATELAGYKQGKGSIQLPLDQAMPLELISRIVAFRVGQNSEKAQKKTAIKR